MYTKFQDITTIPSHLWQNSWIINELVSMCNIYTSSCNRGIILKVYTKFEDITMTPSYIWQNSWIINEIVSIGYIYPSNYNPSIIANLPVVYDANGLDTYWENPLTAKNGTFATFSKIRNEMVPIWYICTSDYISSIIVDLTVEYEAYWANIYWENSLTMKNGTFATLSQIWNEMVPI